MGEHPIASMLGGMVGGIIPIILLAILFEKVIFSMVFDDPVMGKGFSVITAWIIASVFYGLNTTGWRGFDTRGFLMFGVPAIVIGVIWVRRGFQLRGMQEELESGLGTTRYDEEVARTFE